MYESFYQLNADPFRLSPDSRFCFAHHSYAKAKAYVEYGLHRAEGMVAVTGRPGTGKSTLIEDLLTGLNPSRIVVAKLVTTQLRAIDLLRMLAFEFKLRADEIDKATLLRSIEGYLAAQAAAGRRVLIIIDEAQDLSADALEELRLLTNLQANGRPSVQIFLLGQEQLHKKITSPSLEQLRQRLVAVSRLAPMTMEETHAYVSHRLKRAGWNGDPEITGDAIELIHGYSKGVPRLVNQTCSRLLLHGSIEQKHKLDGDDAQAVIKELAEEAPPLRDENSPQTGEPPSSSQPTRLSDIKMSSSKKSAYSRDQATQRDSASNTVVESDGYDVIADKAAPAKDGTLDKHGAARETKTRTINGAHGSQPAAEPCVKSKRAKSLIAVLIVVIFFGAVAVAALNYESFGSEVVRWSRDIAVKMHNTFAGFSLGPDKKSMATKSVTSAP